jgi:hypothetical protein
LIPLILMTALLLPLAAAPGDIAAEVARLAKQLNSDELTARNKAEEQLTALGPAALPHLPATTDRTPAEVATRLARVRQALQQARAQQAAEGSTVTLEGDLPPGLSLKDFSKQSGNTITDHRELDEDAKEPAVTVKFDKVLFWRALDELLDDANLDVDHFLGEPGIVVVARAPGRQPRTKGASYAGPFRLEATRFEALRDLRSPGNRSLKLFVEASWEPRLKPIIISLPLDEIRAMAGSEQVEIDGQGEPTAPIGDGASAIELEIPLRAPQRSIERIDSVKGRLKAIVPGDVETFRFVDLPVAKDGAAKKIEQRKASVTVTVDALRKNNDIWELELRVRFDDPSGALDSYLSGWLLGNEAFFEKPGDSPIEPGTLEQTRQLPNEIGVKYLFDLPQGPKGLTFVYKSPTAVFTIPVDYEFKDLELP